MSDVKLINAYDLFFANEDKTAISMVVITDGIETINEPTEFIASGYDIVPHGKAWFKRAYLGEFGSIKPYEPYVQTEDDLFHEATMFFGSEKAVALRIEEDYRLGLADISDEQMREVKEYIRAINPTAATRSIPIRPHIMTLYDPLN